MDWLSLSSEIDVAHIGPHLSEGQLPSVIYFALSSEESLSLDPFNQPALFLANRGIRLFSFNLPAHGPGLSALDAIGAWATEYAAGRDPLTSFIERVSFAIDILIEKGWAIREKIGLMGLSRGGFIALHVLAKSPQIHSVLSFAPMLDLKKTKEFKGLHAPSIDALSLLNVTDQLVGTPIRLYMGNRDTRVGTRTCFDFVEHLVHASFEKGVRSPPIELLLTPSIGHMGHGTSKETFHSGAAWLAKQLREIR